GCATFQKAAGAPTSTRLIAAGAARTATTVLPGWGSVKPLHRAEASRQDAPRRRPDDRYSATSQDEHRRLTASGPPERSATRSPRASVSLEEPTLLPPAESRPDGPGPRPHGSPHWRDDPTVSSSDERDGRAHRLLTIRAVTIPRAERRAWQRRTSLGTPEKPLVDQRAEAAAVPEDDVVEHLDPDQIARLAEPPREGEVFRRRRGISTRMVVDEDECGG